MTRLLRRTTHSGPRRPPPRSPRLILTAEPALALRDRYLRLLVVALTGGVVDPLPLAVDVPFDHAAVAAWCR